MLNCKNVILNPTTQYFSALGSLTNQILFYFFLFCSKQYCSKCLRGYVTLQCVKWGLSVSYLAKYVTVALYAVI